jgi:hypothetical protein
MQCRDGHCMVSPTPLGGLPKLFNWLTEDGLGSELPTIDASDPVALLAGVGRLMELMRGWTRNKTASEVFSGAPGTPPVLRRGPQPGPGGRTAAARREGLLPPGRD